MSGQSIRCLTLWQPWATLVAIGVKQWETRAWLDRWRGRIAIHAAASEPRHVARELCAAFSVRAVLEPLGLTYETLPRGCILCTCDWGAPISTDKASELVSGLERLVGNYTPGRYAYPITNVRQLRKPYKCRGSQRFWRFWHVDESVTWG